MAMDKSCRCSDDADSGAVPMANGLVDFQVVDLFFHKAADGILELDDIWTAKGII